MPNDKGHAGAPLGLLSPANADLYRRFEAEEAKTNHLRAKERQQSASLAALTARLDELNRALVDEEISCNTRTAEIKQELETLDTEEAQLDAEIKVKKKQLQSMSAAVADIQIQLAYNFTLLSGAAKQQAQPSLRRLTSRRSMSASPQRSSCADAKTQGTGHGGAAAFSAVEFAESLSADELLEIVGESFFVDDNGDTHRVVFTDTAEDDETLAASPVRRDKGRADRSRQAGGETATGQSHWLQSVAAKKASFLLLQNARRVLTQQLASLDAKYDGVDCGSSRAEAAAIQKKLDDTLAATRALLMTTPTGASLQPTKPRTPLITPGSPLRTKSRSSRTRASLSQSQQSAHDGAVGAAIAAALSLEAVQSEEFKTGREAQRRQLMQLQYQLASEEQLLKARSEVQSSEWIDMVKARDIAEFCQTRLCHEVDRRHSSRLQTTSVSVREVTFRCHNEAVEEQKPTQRPTSHRSDAVKRPSSAAQRYATAATRALKQEETLRDVSKYESRFIDDGSKAAAEYRLASHLRLEAAVRSRTERKKERTDIYDEYDVHQ